MVCSTFSHGGCWPTSKDVHMYNDVLKHYVCLNTVFYILSLVCVYIYIDMIH